MREFYEWRAYYELEPWGEEREDLRLGLLCALIANIHAKKGRSFKPADFMPRFGRPRPRQMGNREMIAIYKHMKAAYGAHHRKTRRHPDREHVEVQRQSE